MSLKPETRDFLQKESLERFLHYVTIHTTSDDEKAGKTPSTERQFDLAKILRDELKELGLEKVELDEYCYVYATLPSNVDKNTVPIGFIAHIDTSNAVSGENVKPIIHKNYDGSDIVLSADPAVVISPSDVPYLKKVVGENIITASGDTLLGADDKAGIAEIMAAMAAFKKFPQLKHGEIRICFTPDEEIGMGTAKITLDKLGKYCYTVDGSEPGEIENECFDAYMVELTFNGVNVHPGFAKNKMTNAVNIAGRYLADLPEWESPEHTEKREGFYHPMGISGNVEKCSFKMIVRDFENQANLTRIEALKKLNAAYEARYPNLKIEMEVKHQYQNMREVLDNYPEVIELAVKAIELSEIKVIQNYIRGGTDGSRLCQMGIPTPNLFAGGMLFHGKKEFIAESSLRKAAETIIHLSALWADKGTD
ncbi:MAG: peptidase T [candidate division Zixibacteria bacterium]|nr:peptidase T [Candidatus Tariuqbacter arcticus]